MISMPAVITLSGPFGNVLLLLGLVVLFLSVRAMWTAIRAGGSLTPAIRDQANGVLFWGGAAGVMGFLGQCQGTYLALNAILAAAEIDPRVVAQGFVISFFPTLLGLGILAYAVVAWACLRLLPRGRGPVLPMLMVTFALFGCGGVQGPGPDRITDGLWAFDTGEDLFLWEFSDLGEDGRGSGEGALSCLVHNIRGERKISETACASASFDGVTLQLEMPNGVRYEGRVDVARRSVDGSLLYVDGTSMEAPLGWSSHEAHPALRPSLASDSPYVYQLPAAMDDGLSVAHASEVGLETAALERTVDAILDGDAGFLKSILIVKDGALVMEEYFFGFSGRDLTPIHSCTKSIASLLTGLAIQEGYIDGVQVPLLDFFPLQREAAGAGWERLTLENLLSMSMALDWSPEEAESLHGTGPEAFRSILARDVAGNPGVDWQYVSMNVNLLAGILHHATGEHADAFAERMLFSPLGIEDWDWSSGKVEGFNLMDGSLQLRPRDMAKIGILVMNGGMWEGRRILEESWLRESLVPRLSAGEMGEQYGYLWWTMPAPGPGGERLDVAFANGLGSQFIFMIPQADLVVVTTGWNTQNGKHMAIGEVLVRELFPGVSRGPDQHISG